VLNRPYALAHVPRAPVFILTALAVLALASGLLPVSIGAPTALAVGIALALLGLTAFDKPAKAWAKYLIQASIVLLGLAIPLGEVARAGVSGLALAAGTIALVFAAGLLLGRWLGTPRPLTALLTAGTAICGGSAIAATASVIGATGTQASLATAIVFILNAGGVYAYPPIGQALGLTQEQFGAWAAIGIHDTAGVVAAAKAFGDGALEHATIIKLTRVLWIVPVALALAAWLRRSEPGAAAHAPKGPPVPWFVGFFLLACLLRTLVPALADPNGPAAALLPAGVSLADAAKWLGKYLLTFALFLIGCGLSRSALAGVGWKPFAQAVILWLLVSVASLAVIRVVV
jgi:uncharacterized integral membrane protein (TIGR00698 family)